MFALSNLRAWKRLHPSWRLVLWTDDDLEKLADGALGSLSELGRAFEDLPPNIVRVDFLRYLILQLFGGIYADIDVQPLRNLSLLLQTHSCIVASEPEPFTVSLRLGNTAVLASNAFMASRPGHPFWGVLMDRVRRQEGQGDAVFRGGPAAVTAGLRYFAALQKFLPREAAVFLAPSMYFHPPLRPGGDLMHRQMLAKGCGLFGGRYWFWTESWSQFADVVCDVYSRRGDIDWRFPLTYPRAFNESFTRHLMFSSWYTNSAEEQSYKHVDHTKDLNVTRPIDFLNRLNNRVMSSFEYEKKMLSLKTCES